MPEYLWPLQVPHERNLYTFLAFKLVKSIAGSFGFGILGPREGEESSDVIY